MAVISHHQIYLKLANSLAYEELLSFIEDNEQVKLLSSNSESVDSGVIDHRPLNEAFIFNIEFEDVDGAIALELQEHIEALKGSYIAWFSQAEDGCCELRYGTIPHLQVDYNIEATDSAVAYFDFHINNFETEDYFTEERIGVITVQAHIVNDNVEEIVRLFQDKNNLLNDISVTEFFSDINTDCSNLIVGAVSEKPEWAFTDEGLGVGEHLVPIRYSITNADITAEYRVSGEVHAQSMFMFLKKLYAMLGIEIKSEWTFGLMRISKYHELFRVEGI